MAGFLPLAAAVLASVDKFIGAGPSIGRLDRRCQSFETLEGEAAAILIDTRDNESRLEPADAADLAGYGAWLTAKCAGLDATRKAINDRRDQI